MKFVVGGWWGGGGEIPEGGQAGKVRFLGICFRRASSQGVWPREGRHHGGGGGGGIPRTPEANRAPKWKIIFVLMKTSTF